VPGVRAVAEDLRVTSLTETTPEREGAPRNGAGAPAGS
jgi:hypothetical protein